MQMGTFDHVLNCLHSFMIAVKLSILWRFVCFLYFILWILFIPLTLMEIFQDWSVFMTVRKHRLAHEGKGWIYFKFKVYEHIHFVHEDKCDIQFSGFVFDSGSVICTGQRKAHRCMVLSQSNTSTHSLGHITQSGCSHWKIWKWKRSVEVGCNEDR